MFAKFQNINIILNMTFSTENQTFSRPEYNVLLLFLRFLKQHQRENIWQQEASW